jgi:hypothetical protein
MAGFLPKDTTAVAIIASLITTTILLTVLSRIRPIGSRIGLGVPVPFIAGA